MAEMTSRMIGRAARPFAGPTTLFPRTSITKQQIISMPVDENPVGANRLFLRVESYQKDQWSDRWRAIFKVGHLHSTKHDEWFLITFTNEHGTIISTQHFSMTLYSGRKWFAGGNRHRPAAISAGKRNATPVDAATTCLSLPGKAAHVYKMYPWLQVSWLSCSSMAWTQQRFPLTFPECLTEVGIDYKTTYIKRAGGQATVEDCREYCLGSCPNCRYFTHLNGVCWCKTSNVGWSNTHSYGNAITSGKICPKEGEG